MFCDRLADARKMLQMSQTDVANALDIEKSRYCKWELGSTKPSIEYVSRLCKLLNVTPNFLFDFNDNDIPNGDSLTLAPGTNRLTFTDSTGDSNTYYVTDNKAARLRAVINEHARSDLAPQTRSELIALIEQIVENKLANK